MGADAVRQLHGLKDAGVDSVVDQLQFHFTGFGPLFYVPEPMVKLFNLDYLREIADAGLPLATAKATRSPCCPGGTTPHHR
jgi:hypothetical protein